MSLALENQLIDFKEVVDGKLEITGTTPISANSYFHDDVWDLTNNRNKRLNSVNDSKLKFFWPSFQQLPDEIIYSIKILTFFYLKCPQLLAGRVPSKKKGYKPNTVVNNITALLIFLQNVYKNSFVKFKNIEKINIIINLSSITFHDLERAALDTKPVYKTAITKTLKDLCNPVVQKYLKNSPGWYQTDIKNLVFRESRKKIKVKSSYLHAKKFEIKINSALFGIAKKIFNQSITMPLAESESYADTPLDDTLFRFLSKQATIDVLSFLISIGVKPNTPVPSTFEFVERIKNIANFKVAFEDYVSIREFDRDYSLSIGNRRSNSTKQRKLFFERYHISIGEFASILERVQRAAQYLLIQFTGVRYSEAITFTKGCLKKWLGGTFVIVGTEIKGRANNLPTDIDEWVACPIVRDAVRVLEECSRFTFNSYLISGSFSVYLKLKEEPYSLSGITYALDGYLSEIDINQKFRDKKHRLSLHRLRHTLSLHMIRAHLGIPYISFHLKHLHNAITQRNSVSQVTIGYGGIEKELFNNVTAINQVQYQLVNDLYHPDAPIAGQNAEEF
jgi:integrase